MDQLNRPPVPSLSGNLSENWRKFIQQVEIFLQAAGKDQESDAAKIAILVNLASPDAIELLIHSHYQTPMLRNTQK